MKKIALMGILLVIGLGVGLVAFSVAIRSDDVAVARLFRDYQGAILANGHETIYEMLSPSTQEWLGTIRKLAMDATPEHFFQLNGRDASLVLELRECFTAEELSKLSVPQLAQRVPALLAPPFAMEAMRVRVDEINENEAEVSLHFRDENGWAPFYANGSAFIRVDDAWTLNLMEACWPDFMINVSLSREQWLDVGDEQWMMTFGVPFDERLFEAPLGRTRTERSLIATSGQSTEE